MSSTRKVRTMVLIEQVFGEKLLKQVLKSVVPLWQVTVSTISMDFQEPGHTTFKLRRPFLKMYNTAHLQNSTKASKFLRWTGFTGGI